MDDLQIGDWVHPVLHVHHICILKGSAHMEDAVHCCNVRQKAVSQPLTISCSPAVQE